EVGGFDDGKARDRQGRGHEWAVLNLNAGVFMISNLRGPACNPDQRPCIQKLPVIRMGGVAKPGRRLVVPRLVAVSDGYELWHGSFLPGSETRAPRRSSIFTLPGHGVCCSPARDSSTVTLWHPIPNPKHRPFWPALHRAP